MICKKISDVIGFLCHPLDDDGYVAMIQTPFTFHDGDEMPVFVEQVGSRIRFFDDGGFYMHFRSRGVNLSTASQTKFIKTTAEQHGCTFNSAGEIEVWTERNAAPQGFANYIGAAMELLRWEKAHTGIAADTSLFVEEVALCLRAWKPSQTLARSPKIEGITGKLHEFAFSLDGVLISAVGLHHAAISSSLHKLIDIKAKPENSHIETMVVLDDRQDPETAKREARVISGVSSVIVMSRLQKNAGVHSTFQ